MNPARSLAVTLAGLLGGCVLPIPVTRTEVPSVHGLVVHSRSGAPVDLAGVMVEGHKETAVITARDGSFHTDSVTRTSPFRVWNPIASTKTETVKLRLARPGFAKKTHEVTWRRGEQAEVHLTHPIALEPKDAEDTAREFLERAIVPLPPR
jgi:hypothetical protein